MIVSRAAVYLGVSLTYLACICVIGCTIMKNPDCDPDCLKKPIYMTNALGIVMLFVNLRELYLLLL